MNDKVVITCALTGVLTDPAVYPAPVTPEAPLEVSMATPMITIWFHRVRWKPRARAMKLDCEF